MFVSKFHVTFVVKVLFSRPQRQFSLLFAFGSILILHVIPTKHNCQLSNSSFSTVCAFVNAK